MTKISDIIQPGWRVCYKTLINEKRFVFAWALYQGESRAKTAVLKKRIRAHRFDFWQETFFEAIAQGNEILKTKSSLWCDSRYRPLYYRIFYENGACGSIEFDGNRFHALLTEGTMLSHEYIPADFLLGGNMMPQVAIMLRLLKNSGVKEFQSSFYSPDVLQTIPYGLTFASNRISTVLGESFTLNRKGWITKAETAEPEVSIKMSRRSLPRWRFPETFAPRPISPPSRPMTKAVSFDVEFPGSDVTIGGTMSVPSKGRKKAAMLFIGGSGRHDRHGYSGKIDLGYHEILDKIALAGIVGLRFDTRGAGSTKLGESALEAGLDQLLDDSHAALNFLRNHSVAANLPVFIAGHSLGGLIALNLAQSLPEIAGLILLATVARPIDEVLIEQTIAQAKELNLTQKTLEQRISDIKEFFYHLRNTRHWTPQTVPPKVYSQKHFRKNYDDLLKRDPLKLIASIDRPILIVQGEKDLQVSVTDAQLLQRAAVERKADLLLLKNCDHFFKKLKGRSTLKAYYDSRRRVSATLIKELQKWILSHLQFSEKAAR